MAITTLAQLQTARRQFCTLNTIISAGSSGPFNSRFASTGEPSGTLAASNTASGIVPTSSDPGYPRICKFANGNNGYINNVFSSKNDEGRVVLFDRLYVAGAYNFNAASSLTGQPSFASRVPNANYSGLELWVEFVTTFTGPPTITVGYTNESGVNSRSAQIAPITPSAVTAIAFPLQSGDSGIQQVNSVTCTGSTAGTFNVMVLRRLADFWIRSGNIIESLSFLDDVFMQQIYDTSAFYVLSTASFGNNGTQLPRVQIQLVEG